MFRFFKTRKRDEVEDVLADVLTSVENQQRPIRDLGLDLIRASTEVTAKTKYLTTARAGQSRQEQMLVFFESVRFFWFFANLNVDMIASKSRTDSVLLYLSRFVPKVIDATYLINLPEGLRKKVHKEFTESFIDQSEVYLALAYGETDHDSRFAKLFGLASSNLLAILSPDIDRTDLIQTVSRIIFDEVQTARFDLRAKQIEQGT